MKKIVGFPLFILMLLVLVACGDSEKTEGDSGSSHNLIISHFLPGSHPIQTEVFAEMGTTLEKETDGRITLELYPANALGDAASHYDMAVTGEADIGLSVHGYTPGRFPLVSVLELPFMAESAEHSSKIIAKLYEEFPEFQDEHSETTPLFLFSSEPAQLISKNHKIETPDDLKGLRVRSPSPQGNLILEGMGATPVSMPMSDVYESLERGVVDAAMVPLETLVTWNFHEIAKYITVGHFSATPFFSVMNTDTYNSFSDSDKKLIDQFRGVETSAKAGKQFDVFGQKGRELSEANNAEFIELTGSKLDPWKEALEPTVEAWIKEMNDKGYPGQEIYDRAVELSNELKN